MEIDCGFLWLFFFAKTIMNCLKRFFFTLTNEHLPLLELRDFFFVFVSCHSISTTISITYVEDNKFARMILCYEDEDLCMNPSMILVKRCQVVIAVFFFFFFIRITVFVSNWSDFLISCFSVLLKFFFLLFNELDFRISDIDWFYWHFCF